MDRGSWQYTGGSDPDHPQEKKKGKTVIWKGLTKTVKRREAKDKGEKEQVPIWMQSSKQ